MPLDLRTATRVMGSLLNAKLGWAKALAVIALVLSLGWVWGVIDMTAARSSLAHARGLQANPPAGYAGAAMVAVSPLLAIIVGWWLVSRAVRRAHKAVAVGVLLLTATVVVHLGLGLMTMSFPVGP